MLEARLDQGSILKKVLDSVRQLVEVANFDCSDRGLHLEAMDISHISLVHLVMKAGSFDYFRCDRPMALGIQMENLTKIMKCAGPNDSISLSAQDDGDVLQVKFASKDGDTESAFKLKLLSIDAESLTVPESEDECVVTLSSSKFQQICRDMMQIGDAVTISVSKKGVTFSVKGKLGDGDILVRPSSSVDGQKTSIECSEDVSLTFSLKYLNDFCKSAALSQQVILRMSNEAPLIVEFNISDDSFIRYYLAPKVSEDDEEEEEED